MRKTKDPGVWKESNWKCKPQGIKCKGLSRCVHSSTEGVTTWERKRHQILSATALTHKELDTSVRHIEICILARGTTHAIRLSVLFGTHAATRRSSSWNIHTGIMRNSRNIIHSATEITPVLIGKSSYPLIFLSCHVWCSLWTLKIGEITKKSPVRESFARFTAQSAGKWANPLSEIPKSANIHISMMSQLRETSNHFQCSKTKSMKAIIHPLFLNKSFIMMLRRRSWYYEMEVIGLELPKQGKPQNNTHCEGTEMSSDNQSCFSQFQPAQCLWPCACLQVEEHKDTLSSNLDTTRMQEEVVKHFSVAPIQKQNQSEEKNSSLAQSQWHCEWRICSNLGGRGR